MRLSKLIALIVAAAALGSAPARSADLIVQSGGAANRLKVQSLLERKFATVVRQQFDFSCGSAALATLLTHHYGRATSESDAFRAMWNVGDQARIREFGFSLLEMKRFLEAAGLRADGFKLTLERVAEIGVPGIALIEEDGYRHFVVVKGFSRGKVLVGDPARGLRTLTPKKFAAVWDGTILFIRTDLQTGKENFNSARDWRLTPFGPTDRGLDGEPLQAAHLEQTRAFHSGFSILTTGSPIR
ncbi:MAG: C39 family peptidase [Parvularculaceae bacterium]|nr:C39 family peptidase [Parvularculaceae bacterium]